MTDIVPRGPMPLTFAGQEVQPNSYRRRQWSIALGRRVLSISRFEESYAPTPIAMRPPERRRSGGDWRFAIGALVGIGTVGLATMGAIANPALLGRSPYRVSVELPILPAPIAKTTVRRHAPVRPARSSTDAGLTATTGDAPAPVAGDEPYLAAAMRTGDLQEWTGADGQTRFLVAGPARVVGTHVCRNLALMIRSVGNPSRVKSSERCSGAGSSVAIDEDGGSANGSR